MSAMCDGAAGDAASACQVPSFLSTTSTMGSLPASLRSNDSGIGTSLSLPDVLELKQNVSQTTTRWVRDPLADASSNVNSTPPAQRGQRRPFKPRPPHFNPRFLGFMSQYGIDAHYLRQNKIANEQLDELMRLCNYECRNRESFFHAITALIRQVQSFRPCDNYSRVMMDSTMLPLSPTSQVASSSVNGQDRSKLPMRSARRVPVPENPSFNLIGRILGPRGLTVRELESRFSCRIYVRGKGSIRDPVKAHTLIGKPGWEHLQEDLHILIIVVGMDKEEMDKRLQSAEDFIVRLLHPRGFDAFKRRQLVSLALMNGTFRPNHPIGIQGMNNQTAMVH